jgi:hypothetical protein
MLVFEEPLTARNARSQKAPCWEARLDDIGGVEWRADVGQRAATTQGREQIEDGSGNFGLAVNQAVVAGLKARRALGR